MDETTTIRNITVLETAKNKRSYRRGQITKLKTRLEELKTYSLHDTKLKELHLVKQELQRETELHCALQSQYEALLASKAKNEELAAEITTCVFEKAFSKLTSRVSSFQHDTLGYRDDEYI